MDTRSGLSALAPKGRRRPAMPNGIPAHEEEIILAEALSWWQGSGAEERDAYTSHVTPYELEWSLPLL